MFFTSLLLQWRNNTVIPIHSTSLDPFWHEPRGAYREPRAPRGAQAAALKGEALPAPGGAPKRCEKMGGLGRAGVEGKKWK